MSTIDEVAARGGISTVIAFHLFTRQSAGRRGQQCRWSSTWRHPEPWRGAVGLPVVGHNRQSYVYPNGDVTDAARPVRPHLVPVFW